MDASLLGELAVWLRATSASEWVRAWPWTWAIAETVHFIGLSVLVGTIGLLDIRLLGGLSGVPLSAVRSLLPYGIAAFVANTVTGLLFVVGTPEQYLTNPAFGWKVLFLLVSGLNVIVFERQHGHRLDTWPAHAPTPAAFKVAGAVSLASWFLVLYFGRMLPYLGQAF